MTSARYNETQEIGKKVLITAYNYVCDSHSSFLEDLMPDKIMLWSMWGFVVPV